MPIAGTVDTLDVDLEVWGPDTQVTVVARPPTGDPVPVTMNPVPPPQDAPEQARKRWRGEITYDRPGVWTVYPSVLGTGYGAGDPYPVAVGPAGPGSDPRHTYATSTDYANVTGETPTVDLDRKLRDASAEVDEVLHFANYTVDELGMPVDQDVARALMLATVEVARWWDANGWDGSGAEAAVQSASIAGVSLGFAAGKGGAKQDLVGSKARRVLASAGLIGGPSSAPWAF